MPDAPRPSGEADSTDEADPRRQLLKLADVVGLALLAYDALADLGETVEGEWQYVTDLRSVYGAELRGLAAVNPGRPVGQDAVAAVQAAIDEIALITDPHRAIDWLSTFPQVVRLAIAAKTTA